MRNPLPAKSLVFCVLALSGLAACQSADPSDGGVSDADIVTCQHDTRVDTYTPNLAKTSFTGAYKVTLMTSDPAPPTIGTNTFTINVEDGTGAPMTSPQLTVLPFMPDHGHGTSVKAAIAPNSDGTLSVTPLYLFMGGVWRIEFNPATGNPDPVDFFFCIAG